jgi:hypothetical protein
MSTPFLLQYAGRLLRALQARGLIDVTVGMEEQIILFVANKLNMPGRTGSLISETSKALIACPFVEELYADDLEIKDLVEELGSIR